MSIRRIFFPSYSYSNHSPQECTHSIWCFTSWNIPWWSNAQCVGSSDRCRVTSSKLEKSFLPHLKGQVKRSLLGSEWWHEIQYEMWTRNSTSEQGGHKLVVTFLSNRILTVPFFARDPILPATTNHLFSFPCRSDLLLRRDDFLVGID